MLDIITVSLLILILAYVSKNYIDKPYRPVSVLIISILFIPLGSYMGLSSDDMGLNLNIDYRWLLILLLFLALVLVVLLISTKSSFVRKIYSNQISKHSRQDNLINQSLRVIFLTALPEEIIFRGILFGLFYSNYSIVVSILFSSFIFYLWHLPEYINKNIDLSFKTLLLNTAPTFFAGIILSLVRVLTGGIFFGWAIHSILNISGLIFARYVFKSKT